VQKFFCNYSPAVRSFLRAILKTSDGSAKPTPHFNTASRKEILVSTGTSCIFIEMSKFDKSEEELEAGIDKWRYALKNFPNLRKRPKALSDKIIAKLFREAEIARFTEQEYVKYEESLKHSRDCRNTIAILFKQGEIEGKIEFYKESVRNAVATNLTVEMISKLTGLSKMEIVKIKKQSEEEN
jgi:predicted transposase/invertase (TIGR01784 family)